MGINRLLDTQCVCSARSWIQSSGDTSPPTDVKSDPDLELAPTVNTAPKANLICLLVHVFQKRKFKFTLLHLQLLVNTYPKHVFCFLFHF